MQKERIPVVTGEKAFDCDTVILVGEMATQEEGHITTLSTNSGPHTKHEFYALAQMALIQLQDGELEVSTVESPIKIEWRNESHNVPSGLAICRTAAGELCVVSHRDLPWRKLLEAAHRHCSRWIRLDL